MKARLLRHSRAAKALGIAFVFAQALDGTLTAVAIQTHGPGIEGNPLIAWYADQVGPLAAIWGAKLFAIGCGAVLYLTARYRAMVALVLVYLLCAVGPWLYLLSRS